MKFINRYIAFAAVLAMLVSSCSKDETSSPADDPKVQSVDLTFGAVLNDLANRAAEVNKNHFDQVPDCAEGEPAFAVIGFSYAGNDYETTVAILSDESGYFTDYSEDLKIPVPNNSSVEVTLTSFMVYDGDPEGDGDLIWIAPIALEEGQFDGYVENALPFSFDVSDGTKPYIDVEVLCYDRRMANEYGYVFFDILPEVIYPLCLFVNYCDENGRHYVADYSVDLYFGTDDTGIQLYDHLEDAGAMATTGDYGEGEYYADPLCLVVPGPPANLPSNQPYLYLVIYPEDWAGTGDIDNSPIGNIQLTWDMVSGLLNDDGETTEYWHLLIGECEGALSGDGNGGGNGDDDLDDDGITNDVDQCPNTPDGVDVNAVGCPDTDGDGLYDNEDDCPNVNPDVDEDGDGCEDGNECAELGGDSDEDGICDDNENEGCENNPDPNCGENGTGDCEWTIVDPGTNCFNTSLNGEGDSFLEIQMNTGVPLLEVGEEIAAGTFGITLTGSGIEYNFDIGTATVPEYNIQVSDTSGGNVACADQSDDNNTVEGSFTYPIYVRVSANICEPDSN